MADRAPMRAALLARPGEVSDKLGDALREAGADVVLVGDPRSLDPETLRGCSPDAVLVALEPEVEDSIDRFAQVLHDPGVLVIFDEAQLAAQRVGWDAARWSRHLSAKLNRHHDVLPPGADNDAQWQPSPGALAAPMRNDALDLADFASEARSLEPLVPRDEIPEPVVASDAGRLELEWTAGDGFDAAASFTLDTSTSDVASGLPVALSVDDDNETDLVADQDGDFDSISIAGFQNELDGDLSAGDLSLDPDVLAMLQSESPDAGDAGLRGGDAGHAPSWDTDRSDALDTIDADADDRQPLDPSAPAVADAATQSAIARSATLSLADAGDTIAQTIEQATDTRGFDPELGSGLSLVDDDASDAMTAAIARDADAQRSATHGTVDLDALAERASALSLAETDTYGHGPLRGAVVVEAGLGGPDAVRQLLAGLSEGFPRPLLVRLQLDGGRYDRLVKQMSRASGLPVALAEAGIDAEPGTAYFMSSELAVARKGAGLVFVDADPAAGSDWLEALPAGDSALLLLSGSDAARVAQAVALGAGGALVAAQSPEECYDHAAAGALIASGGAQGTPAQLAERLVERWS